MGAFDEYTDYDKESGVQVVRMGYMKPVTEREFNEMQLIARERSKKAIFKMYGDCIFDVGTYVYATGTLTITNEFAFVNGELIDMSTNDIAVAEGESVYLDVYEETEDKDATIYKFGNKDEATITNWFEDARIALETSQRTILSFGLSITHATALHTYVLLGTVTGGAFIHSKPILMSQDRKNQIYFDVRGLRNNG